jgi:hypothetical protein
MSVKQAFSSAALLYARTSIPGMSIPSPPALFSVFAVGEVTVFKLVIIVVLGVLIAALLYF